MAENEALQVEITADAGQASAQLSQFEQRLAALETAYNASSAKHLRAPISALCRSVFPRHLEPVEASKTRIYLKRALV